MRKMAEPSVMEGNSLPEEDTRLQGQVIAPSRRRLVRLPLLPFLMVQCPGVDEVSHASRLVTAIEFLLSLWEVSWFDSIISDTDPEKVFPYSVEKCQHESKADRWNRLTDKNCRDIYSTARSIISYHRVSDVGMMRSQISPWSRYDIRQPLGIKSQILSRL